MIYEQFQMMHKELVKLYQAYPELAIHSEIVLSKPESDQDLYRCYISRLDMQTPQGERIRVSIHYFPATNIITIYIYWISCDSDTNIFSFNHGLNWSHTVTEIFHYIYEMTW